MKKEDDEMRLPPKSSNTPWTLRILCLALFIRPSDLSSEDQQKYEGLAAIAAPIIIGVLLIAAVVGLLRLLA